MKRIMAIFLCLTLLLAVPAMAEGMKAGTYTETVKGMFDGLVVEVTLSDSAIESVVIKEHNETSPGYPALEKLPGMIVEAQSIAVDGISGATMNAAQGGYGRDGRLHWANFFELAEQPLEVTMAVSDEAAERLFARITAEGLRIFYTKVPVEFGITG